MGVFGPNLGPLIPKLMFRNGYDSIGFGAVFEPQPIEVNDLLKIVWLAMWISNVFRYLVIYRMGFLAL